MFTYGTYLISFTKMFVYKQVHTLNVTMVFYQQRLYCAECWSKGAMVEREVTCTLLQCQMGDLIDASKELQGGRHKACMQIK